MADDEKKQKMTDEELEQKMENKIESLGDKLRADVAEKRLYLILKLIGLIGIGIPLVLTLYSQIRVENTVKESREEILKVKTDIEERLNKEISSMHNDIATTKDKINNTVNSSINSMNNNFSELVITQRKKPRLAASYDNKELSGSVIDFKDQVDEKRIIISNDGDATAKNVRIFLYTNHSDCIYLRTGRHGYMNSGVMESTDKRFNNYHYLELGDLDNSESTSINMWFTECDEKIKSDTLFLMLRCAEQKPVSYKFAIQKKPN